MEETTTRESLPPPLPPAADNAAGGIIDDSAPISPLALSVMGETTAAPSTLAEIFDGRPAALPAPNTGEPEGVARAPG